MDAGRVVQVGHGREIYDRPATEFVAAFLGDPVLLVGEVTSVDGRRSFVTGPLLLQVDAAAPEGPATLLLRPERLRLLSDGAPSPFDNTLPGEVVFAAFDGTGIFVQVELESFTLSVHTTMRDSLEVAIGDRVQVAWNAGEAAVIPKEPA
jgi:putative spermidine/putrescine transport system ATP-binding protein